ncbi:uncharacterized protein Z520_09258 [Fonsecaea multimorphosa CBS 102226]|uniref:Enoyl reductase (ER) domain-containing protein n=1 Tax=Fonsecaea multimorphosa CBS 102226 TaxID=1442371 RepID=A0A0D2KE36_9EURO|nr:uncharacterized protein Z520_09258 [Fonsecaea multimorphosa CBS 102226]KIX94948.1 hypothetical protein Z520_09258 [Fonsecaea multimorphosa CBS 102226]OAL20599.1 hypothetical protein AYO22_08608 [Fonsecaea multimorphosa]
MAATATAPETPSEMLAAQLVEFKSPPVVQKTRAPTASDLGPYDLLLRTAVASLCHTDLMVQAGFMPLKHGLPMTLSHEGTGVVVAAGASAQESFKPGDRVMSGITFHGCGRCENCQAPPDRDWKQYCFDNDGALGVVTDGAFAEYHVVDARMSCKVPERVSFLTAAPLACAGVTVYRGLKVSGVGAGGWVAIVGGGGGLGHFGVQFAKAAGMKVIAVEARDDGIEIAKKYGADHVLDAREGKDKVAERVRALTSPRGGVDATVNVSDHPSTAALSASITRSHGTVVQAAQPVEVTVPFQEIVLRDITIKGTMHGGPGVADEMLQTVATHGIVAETQVFHGLDEVPKMFELLEAGKVKGKAVCVVDKELV